MVAHESIFALLRSGPLASLRVFASQREPPIESYDWFRAKTQRDAKIIQFLYDSRVGMLAPNDASRTYSAE